MKYLHKNEDGSIVDETKYIDRYEIVGENESQMKIIYLDGKIEFIPLTKSNLKYIENEMTTQVIVKVANSNLIDIENRRILAIKDTIIQVIAAPGITSMVMNPSSPYWDLVVGEAVLLSILLFILKYHFSINRVSDEINELVKQKMYLSMLKERDQINDNNPKLLSEDLRYFCVNDIDDTSVGKMKKLGKELQAKSNGRYQLFKKQEMIKCDKGYYRARDYNQKN